MQARSTELTNWYLLTPLNQEVFKRHCLGGYREWGTPVPIPNTVVKPLFADDTCNIITGKVGRRQDSAF